MAPKAPKALEGPGVIETSKILAHGIVIAPEAPSLEARVTELEGDLVRVVDLLIKGDLDSAKFKAILEKRQGSGKLGA